LYFDAHTRVVDFLKFKWAMLLIYEKHIFGQLQLAYMEVCQFYILFWEDGKVKCILLETGTLVKWRVDDMSHDIEDVLSDILKNTNFALQVDESTDTTRKSSAFGICTT
jgi:hypothetical protein